MITLTRQAVVTYESPNRHTWPLKVTAVASGTPPEGVPALEAEIFVYHAGIEWAPLDGDVFECVASAPQMTELPKDEPAPGVPFYRSAELEFYCRSPEEAETLWEDIQHDVIRLVQNWKSLYNLEDTEVVVVE